VAGETVAILGIPQNVLFFGADSILRRTLPGWAWPPPWLLVWMVRERSVDPSAGKAWSDPDPVGGGRSFRSNRAATQPR